MTILKSKALDQLDEAIKALNKLYFNLENIQGADHSWQCADCFQADFVSATQRAHALSKSDFMNAIMADVRDVAEFHGGDGLTDSFVATAVSSRASGACLGRNTPAPLRTGAATSKFQTVRYL